MFSRDLLTVRQIKEVLLSLFSSAFSPANFQDVVRRGNYDVTWFRYAVGLSSHGGNELRAPSGLCLGDWY